MSRTIHLPEPKYKVGYTMSEIQNIETLLGVLPATLILTSKDLIDIGSRSVIKTSALIREIRRVKNGKNSKIKK